MGPKSSLENRIVPSAFQVPPPLSLATPSARTAGVPPAIEIFFNFPSAAKASNWPSYDQNGLAASSVPSSTIACCASRGRSHNLVTPCSSTAEKASVLPSGETTTGPISKPDKGNEVPGGGGIYDRTENAGGGVGLRK